MSSRRAIASAQISASAELTNTQSLDVGKQANSSPTGKAFFVRHNELVSTLNWSQSQRRSVESSDVGS